MAFGWTDATDPSGKGTAMAQGFSLRLLGGFRLTRDDAAVVLPGYVSRLIAYLAVEGDTGRATLAGALWPCSSGPAADANLRTALWQAHRRAPGVVTVTGQNVTLADDVVVDLHTLRAWIRDILNERLLTPELTLPPEDFASDLLPSWGDEWLIADRAALQQVALLAFESVAELFRATDRHGAALYAVYLAIRGDPLRESAHRIAIRIHLDQGNLATARVLADAYTAMIRHELGVAPTPQFCALVQETDVA